MENIPWKEPFMQYAYSPLVKGDFKREFPYSAVKSITTSGDGSTATYLGPDTLHSMRAYFPRNEWNAVRNRAVSKVDAQLQVVDNLFEAIYERNEAYKMLLSAGKGMLKFLKNWRKPKYWKSLKAGAQPKTLPEAWLAYNFGVMPLAMSIQQALNLLGSDFPTHMVRGASGASFEFPVSIGNYAGRGNPFWPFQRWGDFQLENTKAKVMYEVRAYVKPRPNPNSALLNAMGVTTPLSTAFSVLPMGWAADYFLNVSELLGNFENRFPGVDIQQVYSTTYIKGSHVFYRYTIERWGDGKPAGELRNNADFSCLYREPASLSYSPVYSFPMIGGKQAANLLSAIALILHGKK